MAIYSTTAVQYCPNNASEGVITQFVLTQPLYRQRVCKNQEKLGHLQGLFALTFKASFTSIAVGKL